ncbi:MAG TPA: hypothetical protein VGC86_03680, partial [Afipia sp.]
MSFKTLMFLTSSLATAGIVVGPLAAQADGMSQLGTWGKPAGMGAGVSNLTCDGVPSIGAMNIRQMNLPRTPGVNTNMSAFRPNAAPGVNANVGGGNVTGNVGMSKPLNVFNRNQDNSGLNVDTGSRNVDTSSATNARGFGAGRQLNVFSGRDTGADAGMNVDTGNANADTGNARRFGSGRKMNVFGDANSAGSNAAQRLNVDTSHSFGGSRHSGNAGQIGADNSQAIAAEHTPIFNSNRAGGFDGSRKIDTDSARSFQGFSGNRSAGFNGGNKIDVSASGSHAFSGGNRAAGFDNSRKIDADSSTAAFRGFGGNRSAGSDTSRKIDVSADGARSFQGFSGNRAAGFDSSKKIDADASK